MANFCYKCGERVEHDAARRCRDCGATLKGRGLLARLIGWLGGEGKARGDRQRRYSFTTEPRPTPPRPASRKPPAGSPAGEPDSPMRTASTDAAAQPVGGHAPVEPPSPIVPENAGSRTTRVEKKTVRRIEGPPIVLGSHAELSKNFIAVEDMPPEMRKWLEERFGGPSPAPGIMFDFGGTKTFFEMENLPQAMREAIEKSMKSLPEWDDGAVSSSHARYVYQGDDGSTHEYDSLDDMPPEVRRIFESLDKAG